MIAHFRRSSAVAVVPLAIVVIALLAWTDYPRWRFEWDWGMLVPGSSLVVLGPILAAAGALDAVRARLLMKALAPDGEPARRSVWPPFIVLAATATSVWLISLIPVAVVLTTSDASGYVRWLPLLAQGGAFIGYVALGVIVGLHFSKWWVPPLLGVGIYFLPLLWREEVFSVSPVVVATYLSGVGTPVAHSIIVFLLSAAIALLLLPLSSATNSSRKRFRWSTRILILFLVMAGLANGLQPASAAEEIANCEPVGATEVCLTANYEGAAGVATREVGKVASLVEDLGVDMPRVLIVSEWDTYRHVGSDLVVGVHPGMMRDNWVPDSRYANDDLLSNVVWGTATGSCESWWSDEEPPTDELSIAAEILLAHLSARLAGTEVDLEAIPEAGTASDAELRVLFEAVFECDDDLIRAALEDMGVAIG